MASKFSRQAVFNFRALSGVSLTVTLAELKINPKILISCVGIKIDYLGCIKNPSLSNKVMISAMLWTQELWSSDISQVSSIYTTEMCPSFLRLEKTGFNNFVNCLGHGVSPLEKQTDSYNWPLQLNFRYFWKSECIDTE